MQLLDHNYAVKKDQLVAERDAARDQADLYATHRGAARLQFAAKLGGASRKNERLTEELDAARRNIQRLEFFRDSDLC
jgi:hypothetical protein